MSHIFPSSSSSLPDPWYCEFYFVECCIVLYFYKYSWTLFWVTVKLLGNSLILSRFDFSIILWHQNNHSSMTNCVSPLRTPFWVLCPWPRFATGWWEHSPFSAGVSSRHFPSAPFVYVSLSSITFPTAFCQVDFLPSQELALWQLSLLYSAFSSLPGLPDSQLQLLNSGDHWSLPGFPILLCSLETPSR